MLNPIPPKRIKALDYYCTKCGIGETYKSPAIPWKLRCRTCGKERIRTNIIYYGGNTMISKPEKTLLWLVCKTCGLKKRVGPGYTYKECPKCKGVIEIVRQEIVQK